MLKLSKLSFVSRTVFASVSILTLAFSSLAQVKLRDALDFDGDNRADYVIFRESDASWYVFTNNQSVMVQPFGIANEDYTTPGDYDGDGIADLSVWRDTNGTWYRVNSQTGTYTIQQWGLPGDEPVARDYDNDGRTDFAVVR